MVRLLTVFSILLLSAAAQAGDGRCVWPHLPVPIQQQALAAGLDNGPGALGAEIPPHQLAKSEQICGLTPENAEALRKAGSGYMLQILAERWFADAAKLSPERLESAWINMDKQAKARIEGWAIPLLLTSPHSKPPAAAECYSDETPTPTATRLSSPPQPARQPPHCRTCL